MARFNLPVQGSVSQGFGSNPDYYRQYGQLGHNGWDIAAAEGTPIYATADGTVIFEGWGKFGSGYPGWAGDPAGIWTLIDHGDCYTGYAHQLDTVVSAGDKVKQGDLIGHVGSSGDASGPHTHFEFISKPPAWSNGYAGRVNPNNFNVGGAKAPGAKDKMDPNDVRELYRTGLHREPESDSVIQGNVGLKAGEALANVRGSEEWLHQNHAVVYFDQLSNDLNNANRVIGELQAQIEALGKRPTAETLAALQVAADEAVKQASEAKTKLDAAMSENQQLIKQQQADQAAGQSLLRRLGQLLGLIK
ncbi:M23 family metallopeptidase [Arthrobacter sp. KNU40]|uniref:M23 family metallopeptidase n=1 Tax=Arthrobacter sp. KNU40 TaxID=3447965 RepID=UPI003F6239E6